MRPICSLGTQRSQCHQAFCGCGEPPPHQGSWDMCQQRAPTSSAHLGSQNPGPKSLEKGALGRAAARGSGIRRPAPCPWRSVTPPPQSRARLPSGSRVRVGPGEGADVPAGASHAVAPPEPRARPGLRPPGSGSVRGVRRERAPRRAPPSGARGLWAREGCHPLTGGSIPRPAAGKGRGNGPTSRPAEALDCAHLPSPCLASSGPSPPDLCGSERTCPRSDTTLAPWSTKSRKRVPWHGTGPEPQCPRTRHSEAWTSVLQRRR